MTRAEIQQVKQRFGIIGNTEALSRAIDVAIQVAPIKSFYNSFIFHLRDCFDSFVS